MPPEASKTRQATPRPRHTNRSSSPKRLAGRQRADCAGGGAAVDPGGKDVEIAGWAATVRQYLAAGLLDELVLHLVPVVLGAGERLLDGLTLTPVEVIASRPSPTCDIASVAPLTITAQ
nr:dihydrofolate reductase family protein [Nocardia transvalensis]